VTVELEEFSSGGRVAFNHPSGGSVHFDRIDPQRNRIYGYVQLFEDGKAEPIAYGSIDLTSNGQRQNLTRDLPASSVPWPELIHTAAHRVIQSQFDGEPPVRLADVEASDATQWLIDPLVEGSGATLLAAAGGSAKSYLCLAAAVSVATGKSVIGDLAPSIARPVLYLDWEADDKTHAHRFRRICAGAGVDTDIPVHYRRESQPLARTVHQVAQICDDYGIEFLVVDSVMLARGGDAFGPQETAALFAAIREIGRPALLADHKSRESLSKGKSGVYGSVVGENSARRVWEIRGSFDEPGRKIVRLENTKANNADRHEPIALSFTWTDDDGGPSVTIGLTAAATLGPATIDRGAHHWQSIQALLEASEPLTVASLQDQLHQHGITVTDSTLRGTLRRYPQRFKNVGTGNKGLWTVTSRTPELFTGTELEPPDLDEPPDWTSDDEEDPIF
jgi:hypothetical protein